MKMLLETMILAVAVTAIAHPVLADTGSPMGNWARGDGAAKVKIAPCGENICATNTWIKPGTKSEKAGDVLVMSVKNDGTGNYKGKAFDPQRNMNYKLNMKVKGDSMTTQGCVLGGLLCKSVSWSKVK